MIKFWQLTVILLSGVTGQSVTGSAVKFAHDPAPTLPQRMVVWNVLAIQMKHAVVKLIGSVQVK